jgi:multidrug efflux pump subunit AcrB
MRPDKGILAWMAKNHVAANLLMMVLILGGIISASTITQEVFPEFDLDIVTISVQYPGTSPEEVEQGIILSIEEEVRSLEHVDRVSSLAYEGRAVITIELVTGSNPDKALQDIKSSIDRISSFPINAERPIINLKTRRREVLRVAIYGDFEDRILSDFAKKVEDDLTSLPGITQVEVRGLRDPEISVNVPQKFLRTYGLTIAGIATTIAQQATDIPAGGIKAQGGEVLLRTKERKQFAREFGDISIISLIDGTVVRLKDIAEINEGFAETEREAYFNGKKAALIYVFRIGDQTPGSISKAVHEYTESFQENLPEGIGMEIYNDRSEYYKGRMRLLTRNGTLGLLLVLIVLGLFLEPRLAFWVAMGMPISIIGSFIILTLIGGSINMVSMFAFIVTLGIIVDDAVVVGENIYYKRQQKLLPPLQASIEGVREMSAPVFVAVATNVIAFVPLLFISGSTGRFFAILPAVIVAVFTISYIESLIVLPAHLTYPYDGKVPRALSYLERVPARCSRALESFVDKIYLPMINWALSSRYIVVVIAIAVLIVSHAYWDNGWINFSFRPRIQTDRIDAEVELPFGSSIKDVRRIAKLVEDGGLRAIEKNGGREILEGVMTDIGRRGSNTAEVTFNLVPQSDREISTREFSIKWRKEVGEIAGLERLFFDYLIGPGGSSAINVEFTHPDPATLELAATDLADNLRSYNGVTDIYDGFAQGKPQLDFKLKPEGRAAGLSAVSLGSQVRHAFYGSEALRLQRGKDEIKVMVRLPASERVSLHDLDQLIIRTSDNAEMPLSQAASIKSSRAYTQIKRVDGKRVINVTASVVPGVANENKVLQSLREEYLPELESRYSGLRYSFEGRQREQRSAGRSMLFGLILALSAIYCLLAALFRSYILGLFIMLSVPFGLVSAMLGHIIMGFDLSFISVFGMIGLCGIVVNGGVVYTVTANRYIAEGRDPLVAARDAAVRRFRPIVLTAVTTFLGLAPMIFEQSVQARFLVPMAISLGFGILFTTPVILLITPSLYAIYTDIKKLLHPEKLKSI